LLLLQSQQVQVWGLVFTQQLLQKLLAQQEPFPFSAFPIALWFNMRWFAINASQMRPKSKLLQQRLALLAQ
jgi:hypothetical protein